MSNLEEIAHEYYNIEKQNLGEAESFMAIEYKRDLPTGKTPRKKQRFIPSWERTKSHDDLLMELYENRESLKESKLPVRFKRSALQELNEMEIN